MITYAKFSGAPVHVKETSNPFWTPDGDLPVFSHSTIEKDITDFHTFVTHLRTNKFSANYNLSSLQVKDLKLVVIEQLFPTDPLVIKSWITYITFVSIQYKTLILNIFSLTSWSMFALLPTLLLKNYLRHICTLSGWTQKITLNSQDRGEKLDDA
jgi:hypothetical protein